MTAALRARATRAFLCACIAAGIGACAAPPGVPADSPHPATIGATVAARDGKVVVSALGEAARRAGLRVGDVVRAYNGAEITSARQLERLILDTPPGAVVAVEILRGGTPLRLELRAMPIDTTPRA